MDPQNPSGLTHEGLFLLKRGSPWAGKPPLLVAAEPPRTFLPRSLCQGKRDRGGGVLSQPGSDVTTSARSPLDEISHVPQPNRIGAGTRVRMRVGCAWHRRAIVLLG